MHGHLTFGHIKPIILKGTHVQVPGPYGHPVDNYE